MALTIACLDVWADAVRQEVQRVAPADWTLRFAQSYEADHQQALARDADVLLPGFAAVDEALLAAAPKVRWVHKWGIGIDRIDQAALRRRGIGLAITTGANSQPVAELALALILAVNRRIPYVNRLMRQGQWPTPEMRETCYQIQGKTVGLLGFGQIGRRLAQLLAGFEVRIVYHDAQRAPTDVEQRLRAQAVNLPELLACSDILSLHLPLTEATHHLSSSSRWWSRPMLAAAFLTMLNMWPGMLSATSPAGPVLRLSCRPTSSWHRPAQRPTDGRSSLPLAAQPLGRDPGRRPAGCGPDRAEGA